MMDGYVRNESLQTFVECKLSKTEKSTQFLGKIDVKS